MDERSVHVLGFEDSAVHALGKVCDDGVRVKRLENRLRTISFYRLRTAGSTMM